MMLKLCGCGKIINLVDKKCEECEQKHSGSNRKEYHKWYDKNRRNRDSRDFYHSKDWRMARAAALARDNYLCVECVSQGRIAEAHAVDHIVPLRVDWSLRFEQSNLQSLCHPCHSSKTRHEQAQSQRVRRC